MEALVTQLLRFLKDSVVVNGHIMKLSLWMNPASLRGVQVTSKHLQRGPFLIDLGAGRVDMLTSRGGESGQFPTRKPQCTVLLMRAVIHDTLVNDVWQPNLLFSSTPPHARATYTLRYISVVGPVLR